MHVENNWWGTTDTAIINAKIYDVYDDASLGMVVYVPYLNSPVTSIFSYKNPILSEFLIFQNYPNPFNPSTKIRYSVPQTSKVVIKVLDILGNEIETLINEEKSVGTYKITWYAGQLPSGIYFYRLQAGSFVETKKMALMK